jgi:hypothetical protein
MSEPASAEGQHVLFKEYQHEYDGSWHLCFAVLFGGGRGGSCSSCFFLSGSYTQQHSLKLNQQLYPRYIRVVVIENHCHGRLYSGE